MSYVQFQQKCQDCGEQWNAAFGIVGMSVIAEAPKHCPKCKSEKVVKIADGWASSVVTATAMIQTREQEIADLRRQLGILRLVCAEAYQLAGSYDAPIEALDNLSAAAQGESLPHETFLPVTNQYTAQLAEAQQARDRAKAELEEWQDYWGADSPHDTHVQAGSLNPFIRQLGKEQARANSAENRLDAANALLRRAQEAIRDLLACFGDACRCHGAYISRNLTDPECLYCDNKSERKAGETVHAAITVHLK